MKESTEEIRPGARKLPVDTQLRIVTDLAVAVAVTGALFLVINADAGLSRAPTPLASQTLGAFVPTRQQLASLGIEMVNRRTFRTEIDTDGYIAPNSSFMVPNSSARNHIGRDMPVLVSQSSDMLQAESDFVTARAQFNLAQTTEKRQHELYKTQGAALKDWQQSQTDLATTAAGSWFKRRCQEAGVAADLSAHGLRKLEAQRCAEAAHTLTGQNGNRLSHNFQVAASSGTNGRKNH